MSNQDLSDPDYAAGFAMGTRIGQIFRSWYDFWRWPIAAFLLALTITNFVQGNFHLHLLPAFENSLQDFRRFAHWVLDTVFLNRVRWLLSEGVFVLTKLASEAFHEIRPVLPTITISDWYKDLTLISVILSRAVQHGTFFYDPDEGNEGRQLAYPLHQLLYAINRMASAWDHVFGYPVDKLEVRLEEKRRSGARISLVTKALLAFLSFVCEGLLLVGITRFIFWITGALLLRPAPRVSVGMIASLFIAGLASFAFFAVNGYLVAAPH